ncbi:hypothetical protein K523DRAFT_342994 [Schizophyllum commune Tattone D]|nr:hypothetical protein K523DRAFT_342994 [Schizophyllum commune Tattone D]
MAWKTTEIGQDPSPPPSSAQTLVGTSSQGSRSASQSTVGPQASGSSLSRKRSNTQPSQDSQSRKRTRPNSPDFTLPPGCIEETADLRLPGELEAGLEADTKPVRYLDSFTIYDPRNAAGFTWPVLVDEDEDDSEDEDEEEEGGYPSSVTNEDGPGPSQPGKGMMSSRTYAHITAIVKIWWDPVAEEDR